MSRRFAALLLAVVAATGLLASPTGTAEVHAATPSLTIVTDAQYDVQPEDQRVRVTVDMVMKNRLKDTSTRRFYFDHAFLSVQPGASAPTITRQGSGSGTPSAVICTIPDTRAPRAGCVIVTVGNALAAAAPIRVASRTRPARSIRLMGSPLPVCDRRENPFHRRDRARANYLRSTRFT